jgi:hypothetical protein
MPPEATTAAVVATELAKWLIVLDDLQPLDDADSEAVADAKYFIEAARVALLDVAALNTRTPKKQKR